MKTDLMMNLKRLSTYEKVQILEGKTPFMQ